MCIIVPQHVKSNHNDIPWPDCRTPQTLTNTTTCTFFRSETLHLQRSSFEHALVYFSLSFHMSLCFHPLTFFAVGSLRPVRWMPSLIRVSFVVWRIQVHSLDGNDSKNGPQDDEDKACWPGGFFVDELQSALRHLTCYHWAGRAQWRRRLKVASMPIEVVRNDIFPRPVKFYPHVIID